MVEIEALVLYRCQCWVDSEDWEAGDNILKTEVMKLPQTNNVEEIKSTLEKQIRDKYGNNISNVEVLSWSEA